MNKSVFALASVALLAGCGGSSTSSPAPRPSVTATPTARVTVAVSHTYHCADGSPLWIDWLSDNSSAVATMKNGRKVRFASAVAGSPLLGSGYIIHGSSSDKSVSLLSPGVDASMQCMLADDAKADDKAQPPVVKPKSGGHR